MHSLSQVDPKLEAPGANALSPGMQQNKAWSQINGIGKGEAAPAAVAPQTKTDIVSAGAPPVTPMNPNVDHPMASVLANAAPKPSSNVPGLPPLPSAASPVPVSGTAINNTNYATSHPSAGKYDADALAMFKHYHGGKFEATSAMDRFKMEQLMKNKSGGNKALYAASNVPYSKAAASFELVKYAISGAALMEGLRTAGNTIFGGAKDGMLSKIKGVFSKGWDGAAGAAKRFVDHPYSTAAYDHMAEHEGAYALGAGAGGLGLLAGHHSGYNAGDQDGLTAGRQQGIQTGMQRGMQMGNQQAHSQLANQGILDRIKGVFTGNEDALGQDKMAGVGGGLMQQKAAGRLYNSRPTNGGGPGILSTIAAILGYGAYAGAKTGVNLLKQNKGLTGLGAGAAGGALLDHQLNSSPVAASEMQQYDPKR